MHFDIEQIVPWIIAAFSFLQRLLGFGKGALETAKTAKELFEDTKTLIEEPESREKGFEQARIVSELLRGYALFGLLEYLYRTTLVFLILMILREARKILTRQKE